MIAAFLVYFMQAGFAMCEAGFTRAKNTGNILMKNMMDFVLGSLCFFLIGFSLMHGTDWNGIIGLGDSLIPHLSNGGGDRRNCGKYDEWSSSRCFYDLSHRVLCDSCHDRIRRDG